MQANKLASLLLFFWVLAHRPEYAPQSVVGVRFTDGSDRLVFKTIIQSRASPPGYCCCCRGRAGGRYCCYRPLVRASRPLLGGLSLGSGCYCWWSHGASRERPLLLLCRLISVFFWLSCRFVVVDGKSEGGCLIIVVLLFEAMAAKPSVLRLFVFLALLRCIRRAMF